MKPRTQHLRNALGKMNENEREVAEGMVDYYAGQINEAKARFVQAEGMAAGLHDLIDEAMRLLIERDPKKAKRIACSKGCAHCCYVQVDITEPEARLLWYAAEEAGYKVDTDHLRAQRDSLMRWSARPMQTRRCVFLKPDNECAVYEHRPIACRKYLVLDNAEQCDTAKKYGGMVKNFVSVEAECVQTAAYEALPNGPMAQMLLEWAP